MRARLYRSALVLLLGLLPSVLTEQSALTQTGIFEIELPEVSSPPTSNPDVSIPSPQVSTVVIHVLNPHADRIDYGQVFTFVNGEATNTLAEMAPSDRGKVVRINLQKRPGFSLIPGRNTVEVRARDRRGREFYSSFVLRTVTENRNQDFRYEVQLGDQSSQQPPPELMMLEPEWGIFMPPSRKSVIVRFAGVATAGTAVERVLVGGAPVTLKRRTEGERKLGLAYEENRVTFDVNHTVRAGAASVTVEAIDASGNRTKLSIPVLGNVLPAAEFKGKKYALIVGISRFRRSSLNLRFADRDANAVYRFLQSTAGGRFLPENMLLLLNDRATLATIQEALSSFIARPGPDDLLLIFMATHGSPDRYKRQDLYFIAHDTDPDRMSETAIAMRNLETAIRQRVTARRRIMLFDTCYSAGLIGSVGEQTRGGNNLMNLYLEKMLYREEGVAVMTSSDVSEESLEAPRWGGGHGVFTHFLLEGLRGRADVNLDRLVTVGELFRFVRHRVRTETAFRQNPRMLMGAGENLAMAAVRAQVSDGALGSPNAGSRRIMR